MTKLYKATISFEVVIASDEPPNEFKISSVVRDMVSDGQDYDMDFEPIDSVEDLPFGWTINSIPYCTYYNNDQISTYLDQRSSS